ncbi:ScbR family autoregulator-binding transcription factor [Streptomyces sp. BBFR51]|uniref:ScbR family autoregulator-binding transcription factor n=1 Tax=Streptomyces sp. BBFR51 TaxID=3372856 RepID=UPI0037DD9AFE
MPTPDTPRRPRTAVAGREMKDLRQERAVRTRAQVLAAAAEAFAARGFPRVTIQDVAELADLTKGAVYFHFGNKESLATAVAKDFYEQLGTIGQSLHAEALPPLEAVKQLLLRTARAFRDNVTVRAGARLQIERSLIESDLPMPYVRFETMVTDYCRQAVAAGQLPTDKDPADLAQVLVSAFFGAQHISWVLNERADLVDRVERILSVSLPGPVAAQG